MFCLGFFFSNILVLLNKHWTNSRIAYTHSNAVLLQLIWKRQWFSPQNCKTHMYEMAMSFESYIFHHWLVFVYKCWKSNIILQFYRIRSTSPGLYLLICDAIKQNESEVGQIQFSFFLTDYIHHLQSYLLQQIIFNSSQLAKMKKSILDMSLP